MSSKLLRHLSVRVKERLVDVFVFCTVVTFCVPTIVRMRSTGYYDDTILFVTSARQLPTTLTAAFSSAFISSSQLGVPATEFALPGFTLLIWTLNWFQILGNLSLNLIAALLLGVFAILVHRFLQISGFPTILSMPIALVISLNPANSEFTYFFIASQHLVTVTCIIGLALISRQILNIRYADQPTVLIRLVSGCTALGALSALFAREFIGVIAVVAAAYLIWAKPSTNYPLVVVGWLVIVPFQGLQIITKHSGWRVSSISAINELQQLVPPSWTSRISAASLPIWIASVLVGIMSQLLLVRRIAESPKSSVNGPSNDSQKSLGVLYPFAVGFLLVFSSSLQSLIVGAVPGHHLFIEYALGDRGNQWLTIRPRSLIAIGLALFLFAVMALQVKHRLAQFYIFITLFCSAVYLESLPAMPDRETLGRYVIYMLPGITLLIAIAQRRMIHLPRRPWLIAVVLWLVLGSQVTQFNQASEEVASRRYDSIQIAASVCSSLDLGLAGEQLFIDRLQISMKSLAHDRWMSRSTVTDLKQLSRSPRLFLLCEYVSTRDTSDWASTFEFLGRYAAGFEQSQLDSARQSIEQGSMSREEVNALAQQMERVFFGLPTS